MCYKISNTASREVMERVFNVSFKFPKLHIKSPVINGLQESLIPIIKMSKNEEVSPAIWGLLPETFEDDWQYFQNIQNTLNTTIREVENDFKYKGTLENRRCVVLVTGFFTYYLSHGDLYPYYVYLKTREPFAIAGVYNELDDGFVTCSIIVTEANDFIKQIHNSSTTMPVILDKSNQNIWLNSETSKKTIIKLANTTSKLIFKAHPIAKEFHKIDVNYDAVLDPVDYPSIPKAI